MYDFFLFFKKIDQPWGPKIDGFIMENTPKTTRRTYVEFCLSFTVIKKSSQISAKSPNLSSLFCNFFYFLKSDQPWRPKIDGFIMENTPITIARTYLEFSLSLTLIKKSGQNLQISQWKNYFCKRQGCKIEKNVDWVLNPFCRIPIEILWHFYSS